ncbi:MAG: SurA N-terminal domain-containing protein [Pseudomonadales bacterium]
MSIQSLRDSSEGVISKILIGLIIVVFALFGFGSITTFLAPVPKVATVNGEDVTQQEMEIAVERNRRLLLAEGRSPAEINEDALRRDVLQNLINRKLLSVAADDLGLFFSDEAIDREIVETEVFQIDGVFNPGQFQMVIGGAGYTPLSYRAEMHTDKKLQQLAESIQESAFLTEAQLRRLSSLAQQVRDIAYLRIDVDTLVDEVAVTEDEVRTYYDNNPTEFMTQETVDLDYIELKRSDLMAQVTVDEEELRQFYEDTRSLYARPENRRVAHILIETNDEVSAGQAEARINDIYERIKSGEDFSELARELSEDPGSAAQGGDLGFSPPGTFVPEFEEVAWELGLNQLSTPVQTEFGYHLIKLLGIEEASAPGFAEVRDQVEQEFREAKAEEIFVGLSGQLSELSFESPDLIGPAAELDLEVKSTGHVGSGITTGIAANPEVIAAALEPDVLMDGNNSRIIEVTPNHHVVVRVREHKPRQIKDFEQVKVEVRQQLARQKAMEMARARAEEIVAMLEEGAITRYVADQYGLSWTVVSEASRNQADMDREINQEAFRLPRPAETTKSVGYSLLSSGDAVVISVTNVRNQPESQMNVAELEGLKRILENQRGAFEYREFRNQLAEAGDISRSR